MITEEPLQILKPIVIKELVAAKNPSLAKKIPGFIYWILNKLIHIKEINTIIEKFGHLRGVPFIEAALLYFEVNVKYKGEENLPNSGRFIFASNHPLGGFDGILLIKAASDRYGHSLSISRDELKKIPPLADLFIPINKFGGQRQSIDLINDAYKSDSQILIFPAGLASRKINGVIADLTWQKHFVQKSIEYQRDVLPIFISGQNSWFFYALANFRKWIGMKTNLEMFLLPDEMFRNRGKTFTITYGKPISWKDFDRKKSHLEWASHVREEVYKLRSKDNK
jgi:putative hemolysin